MAERFRLARDAIVGRGEQGHGFDDQFAASSPNAAAPDLTVHALISLVAQRVFGLALGYEDLNDHDELRGDPVLGVLIGDLERAAKGPSPVAGKITLSYACINPVTLA